MNVVSQKDKLLADYQKQVELLQKAEGELTKQIEEQKGKNNVSYRPFHSTLSFRAFLFMSFDDDKLFNYLFFKQLFSFWQQWQINEHPGIAYEKLEIGWSTSISPIFNC